jgi:glycosyltransferase involved in cell wall biosynthesis
MKVTVILCTYNRCSMLRKALESVAASEMPDSDKWEVLVVDNNSNDQTKEVTTEFCNRYPGIFRYIFERQPGKSYALNSGIQEAKGEILAFMDDDVTVEPAWIRQLVGGLENKEWAGVGGRILPPQDFSPPVWMPITGKNSMAGILAIFDRGMESGELTEAPYGTNMAFRKTVFEKYGGFRTDLGPSPGNEIRAEDTEFGDRVRKGGERLWYEPTARVHHAIPAHRLKKKYFLAWWFDYGRSNIRLKEKGEPAWGISPRYLSIFNRLLRLLPRKIWIWMKASGPQDKFVAKCWVWVTAGEIAELVSCLFEAKPPAGIPQSQVVKD